ncbi:MAG: parallel beta-helix domain-containing protein [Pseudomonadota bacterium]
MLRPLLCASALAIAAPAHAKTIDVQPSDNDQEAIQLALLDAQPGDTVHIRAGTYALSDGLSLDVDGVTIRGDGPAATILSFKGQTGAGEGLLVTSDRVLMTGFAIEDTRGDAIKAKGVDRITFDDVRAEWTNGPDAENGAYGLYPVESTNILIMNSEVIAASDAGIYVGQSDNIVVRDNRVHMNVAGIEIENSTNAEVHDNHAWGNTAGVLVFDLPNLPKMGGHSTVVRDNVIVANNTPNFAAPGNIVAGVPAGTGVIVMANRNVHVVDNFFDGHASAQVMVVGYSQPFEDADYNPLPRDIVVADNIFGRGGDDPQFEGGAELAAAVGGRIPPIMWDGAAAYLRDGALVEEPVVMHFDMPALTLGLAKAGDAPASGTPGMAPTTDGKAIPRPDPIVMPADQPGVAPADIAMATGN